MPSEPARPHSPGVAAFSVPVPRRCAPPCPGRGVPFGRRGRAADPDLMVKAGAAARVCRGPSVAPSVAALPGSVRGLSRGRIQRAPPPPRRPPGPPATPPPSIKFDSGPASRVGREGLLGGRGRPCRALSPGRSARSGALSGPRCFSCRCAAALRRLLACWFPAWRFGGAPPIGARACRPALPPGFAFPASAVGFPAPVGAPFAALSGASLVAAFQVSGETRD